VGPSSGAGAFNWERVRSRESPSPEKWRSMCLSALPPTSLGERMSRCGTVSIRVRRGVTAYRAVIIKVRMTELSRSRLGPLSVPVIGCRLFS